jgi:hypothetical protein
MFSCLWSREHVIQREFIWNWHLINRKNKNNSAVLVCVQFHTLVIGRLKLNNRLVFRQRRRYSLISRDALLSRFATIKVLCDSLCDTSKENVHYRSFYLLLANLIISSFNTNSAFVVLNEKLKDSYTALSLKDSECSNRGIFQDWI